MVVSVTFVVEVIVVSGVSQEQIARSKIKMLAYSNIFFIIFHYIVEPIYLPIIYFITALPFIIRCTIKVKANMQDITIWTTGSLCGCDSASTIPEIIVIIPVTSIK
jgi:hypothetical protein